MQEQVSSKTKPAWAMLRRIGFAGRHSPRITVESRSPLRLSWYVSTHPGVGFRGSSRNSCRRTSAPGKSVRRVQRDGPHQIGPNRTKNERNIHNVKERKEEKRIWKKTAADDEPGRSAARRCRSHPVARKLAIAPNSSMPP